MPKKRAGRATWFKLALHHKALIDAVPDDVAGKALKAAMAYFQDRTQAELDPLAMAVYSVLKASADEAFVGYDKAVSDGGKGGRPTERDGNPPLPTVSQGIPKGTHKDIRYNAANGLKAISPGICDHDTSWLEVE